MSTEGVAGIIGLAAVIGIAYAVWRHNTGGGYDDGYEEVWYEEWSYEERWYDD